MLIVFASIIESSQKYVADIKKTYNIFMTKMYQWDKG